MIAAPAPPMTPEATANPYCASHDERDEADGPDRERSVDAELSGKRAEEDERADGDERDGCDALDRAPLGRGDERGHG